jgi:integrase
MKNTTKLIDYRDKIYLYYSKDGKVLRIPTGINTSEKKSYQVYLEKLLNDMNNLVISYKIRENTYPEIDYLKNKMNIIRNSKDDLECLIDIFIDDRKKSLRINTINNYNSVKNILIGYNEKHKIDINKLDTNFIMEFVKYLYENGNIDNTVKERLIKFKAIITYWINKNLVKDYYIDWKSISGNMKSYKTHEETLTKDELKFLIEKRSTDTTNKKMIDILLFGCLTSLRYSDIITVNRDHIIDNFIVKETIKTKEEVNIPLNNVTKCILEENNYNLDIYFHSIFNLNVKQLFKLYSGEMESFKEIKSIKKSVKGRIIEEKKFRYDLISSHIGRRTFITLSLMDGIPIPEIQKCTGHKDINILIGYNDKKQKSLINIADRILG